MNKTTPGPWYVYLQYTPHLGCIAPSPYVVDTDGRSVAAALLGVPPEEHAGNAYLVAAAPELLAACEAARAYIPMGNHTGDLLRAALDKAKGGVPETRLQETTPRKGHST